MGTVFSGVLQLLSFLPEYTKSRVPVSGPAHVHVQEGEYVGRAYLNVVLITRRRDVKIACPYLHCELKVLVSLCLVLYLFKCT